MSQSKSLTVNEIKNFKCELENYIIDNWNKTIIDSEPLKVDIFTGTYSRWNEYESSDLEVTYLGGNKIHVKGNALYGKTKEFGPNIGQIDFITEIKINKATFIDKLFNEEYKLELEFLGDKLIADEKYVIGYFGMNVSFEGEYYKLKQ
ncbi:MAG: hypothetical protein GY936_02845 [Ignavibacteriae bacterium]|nr:hypothetical protein [Ignavibacteriota bacterium]